MSEPNLSPKSQSNYTIWFMAILSLICAVILSILASALREPQMRAKELDRSKQMLIAARIISPYGYFQVQDNDQYFPAQYIQGGGLKKTDRMIYPSGEQVLEVYRTRISPFLVNDQGEEKTFQGAGINEQKYVQDYRKSGYYKEPLKLVYKVFANPKVGEDVQSENRPVEGYVFPINGMGLWDAIYGYLALKTDGDSVIGISWYDQKETPGLGANIAEPEWQSQFPGKVVFQESTNGKTDFATAPLGIVVVKGKVNEVLGNSPKIA